jgi:hypothetical protein
MRKTNPLLIKHDHLLLNFIEFAKHFYISRNNLMLRANPDLTVVITHPTVQYQPLIKEIYNKNFYRDLNLFFNFFNNFILYFNVLCLLLFILKYKYFIIS